MKYIPLLFSTPMVQAILDGRKTQTRRIVKKGTALDWLNDGFTTEFVADPDNNMCPYGKIGDVLWVRETFHKHEDSIQGSYAYSEGEKVKYPPHILENGIRWCVDFKADYPKSSLKWKPSLFMPKSACRIFLEVVSVKVERLQEISEDDAIQEGVEFHKPVPGDGLTVWKNYTSEQTPFYGDNAKLSFQKLWQSINGADSWEANPFVWVIEFKRIDKPETFI